MSNNFYLGFMPVKALKTFLIILLVSVLGLSSCKPFKTRKAVDLNNAVIGEQRKLMLALEEYYSALNLRDKVQIRQTLTELQEQSKSGAEQLAGLEAPECGAGFLDAAADLFRFYEEASVSEYERMAGYYFLDSMSYEGYDSLQMIERTIEREREAADRNFIEAQQSFAQSCGFKLVRNAD